MVIEINWIRQPETACQFILQPEHTNNPQNICEETTCLHHARPWNLLTAILKCICDDSFTDVLRVVSVLWL